MSYAWNNNGQVFVDVDAVDVVVVLLLLLLLLLLRMWSVEFITRARICALCARTHVRIHISNLSSKASRPSSFMI
jgi:hypothetical protein